MTKPDAPRVLNRSSEPWVCWRKSEANASPAPPAGATRKPGLDLMKAAERYRALLELGDEMGVVPQIETWGFIQESSPAGPGDVRG